MYQLEDKTYFIYFVAVALLILGFVAVEIWKKKKQKEFADLELLDKLSPEKSNFKPWLKTIMVALSLSFLIIALVNPKMGTKLETVKSEGVDIVFTLDVSKSMLAEDIAPNRLEKAKQIVTKIINNLGSDRVGIIIYAGSAYPLLPITTDQAAAKMFLQNASPDMVSSQGTAINQALELAATYFDDKEQTNKYLILISDGEDHNNTDASIAEEIAKQGIKLYTIGIGTKKGAPIPIKIRGQIAGYKKDRKGEMVITKLHDEILKEIAEKGNGKYLSGNNTQKVVDYIKEVLKNADKKEFETKSFSDFKSQFQWFIGFGILFLLLDTLMFNRKTKWIEKLNLFNEKKNA
jgi:Ca-activated chloride channel family protein